MEFSVPNSNILENDYIFTNIKMNFYRYLQVQTTRLVSVVQSMRRGQKELSYCEEILELGGM